MSAASILTFKFDSVLVKISTEFFTEFHVFILNYIQKNKCPRYQDTFKEEQSGRTALPDIKSSYKAIINNNT